MRDYVYYDNTDCGGIVYHTNYIVFCERARSRIFFDKGMFPNIGYSGFVVKTLESTFISPLMLGDTYEVRSILLDIKITFMIIKQDIFIVAQIENPAPLEELCFSMTIKMAFVDLKSKKPCKIPDEVLAVLEEYRKSH